MVRNARPPKLTFSQILKSSVERETTTRGWCSRCQRYQSLATRKTIRSVPLVLVLNAAINSAEARQFWSIPGWLPNEIGVILDAGQFFCYEGEDLRLHLQRGIHPVTVYSLIGLAAEIDSGQHQKSHLVSLVNSRCSPRRLSICTDVTQLHILSRFHQDSPNGISLMTFLSGRYRRTKHLPSTLLGNYPLSSHTK